MDAEAQAFEEKTMALTKKSKIIL